MNCYRYNNFAACLHVASGGPKLKLVTVFAATKYQTLIANTVAQAGHVSRNIYLPQFLSFLQAFIML